MPGRRQQRTTRLGLRWLAGALSVGLAATAGAAILASAGPASAAPTPSYHPGLDTATFAVTGVLDHNCVVSTGGTEVWIKPGDKINFNSSAAGINLSVIDGLLTGAIGKVVGLNVSAVIDAGTTHARTFTVAGGKTTLVPKVGQAVLPAGDHSLKWTATSLAVLPTIPVLGGLGPQTNVPLSSNALQSGAKLSWTGVIHVTNDAAQCKLGVGTPQVGVSVGPVKVTVPPINVNVPNLPKLPGLPGLPGGGGKTTPGGHQTTPAGGFRYTPPALTVPEQAMGRVGNGGGAAGGFDGVAPDGGSASRLGSNLPQVPVAGGGNDSQTTDPAGKAHRKIITTLASNKAPAAHMPILLAIIAIIALSLVTATYARLYLLRRNA